MRELAADTHTGFFTPDLSKAAKFPTAPRRPIFDEKAAHNLPGPGSYALNQSTLSTKGVRIGNGRSQSVPRAERAESPGPAAYDVHPPLSHLPGGVITRAPRPSPMKELTPSPGPCQYDVDISTLNKKGAPIPRSRRLSNGLTRAVADPSPGPAAYSPSSPPPRPAPASFPRQRRRVLEFETGISPGPCSYQSTDGVPRTNRGGTFGRAKREISFVRKDPLPGPGEYTPLYAFESRFTK